MHPLLKRQLKRHLSIKEEADLPKELQRFCAAISQAYDEFDADRAMVEHTLNITSEEITERNQEILKANAELERFAYVVSHDLQEPLRAVAGYTQLLKRRYNDTLEAKAVEYIDGAVDGAKRMQELIKDLLEYSRIGFGKIELKATELGASIQGAIHSLKGAIDESAADVRIEGSMPTVLGDKRLLQQLIQNIVSNALKFRSERKPEVLISAQENRGRWTVSIADNGIGIPENEFQRVFDVFQRLHS